MCLPPSDPSRRALPAPSRRQPTPRTAQLFRRSSCQCTSVLRAAGRCQMQSRFPNRSRAPEEPDARPSAPRCTWRRGSPFCPCRRDLQRLRLRHGGRTRGRSLVPIRAQEASSRRQWSRGERLIAMSGRGPKAGNINWSRTSVPVHDSWRNS